MAQNKTRFALLNSGTEASRHATLNAAKKAAEKAGFRTHETQIQDTDPALPEAGTVPVAWQIYSHDGHAADWRETLHMDAERRTYSEPQSAAA